MVLVAQSCPTLCDPIDCGLQGSYVDGILQQKYWSELPFPSPGNLPDPGIKPAFPALAGEFLTTEPPESPCLNTLYQLKEHWIKCNFN